MRFIFSLLNVHPASTMKRMLLIFTLDSLLAMNFHDFSWGSGIAHWDQKALSQSEFNLRISAVSQLNNNPSAVSFSLCNVFDIANVRDAHHNAGWTGGEYNLYIDKTNVVDPTQEKAGLITRTNAALVSFRGPQSEAVWCFASDRSDRSQRWRTKAVLQKHRGLDGQVINPAEQPTDVDRRAMEHWSGMKDWIFCDGFGSGTTLIAALECGRSIVGTEPDERQWESACARLDAQISNCLRFDDQQARRAAEQQRAEQEEKEAAEKAERASQKTQSLKEKLKTKAQKRKQIADEEEPSEGQVVEEEPGVHFFLLTSL